MRKDVLADGGPGSVELAVGDRFAIKSRIGAGGMGVVYRARDRARGIDVALKTLRKLDASALYRFKNEFRALAGIVHPNLVTLYELHSAGDIWYFTMELVEGVDFLEYVRPHNHLLGELAQGSIRTGEAEVADVAGAIAPPREHAGASDTVSTVTSVGSSPGTGHEKSPQRAAVENATLNAERLRAALPALVQGLAALHQSGRLHRDIKPSNVLVDWDGRVVVCDFGLAVQVESGGRGPRETHAIGTPLFMSPEQAANATLSPASDWYSVGAMLYLALTGHAPFEGSNASVLALKQEQEARPASEIADDVPADLNDLCGRLLRRDPAERPTGEELLETLGLGASAGPAPPDGSRSALFVGREAELATLGEALGRTRDGASAAVFVHGPSGIGKSALIDRFLDDLARDDAAVILRGRCYERESVPYKALDSLVDALASVLVDMPAEKARELVPRDIAALALLFPVLGRVEGVGDAAAADTGITDPQELRLRAFAALRVLLRRLAEARPTVLYIDDLQWGDMDSGQFLIDLIHQPNAPPVLLVGSYRTEEAASSELLSTLLREESDTGIRGDMQQLALGPLRQEEAQRLARQFIGYGTASGDQVARIIAEARGNPFFIAELARAAVDPAGGRTTGLSLDDVLARRIAALPDEAGALLSAACVAGRPLPLELLSRTADVRDRAAALAVLLAGHLLRTRGSDDDPVVEPYHDRVRETVTGRLSVEASRRMHHRLARALETSGRADPLALVELWLGAGDRLRAARYANRAARLAEQTLAFDRAAHHYRLVLELTEPTGDQRRAALTQLANALAAAGRLVPAADVFLDAAEDADRTDALELRRRALEQLLRAGEFERGLEAARTVLAEVGLSLPGSRTGLLASIALGRARLALRGLKSRERPEDERDPELLQRVDICWSVSSGLTFADPMLGTTFQTRQLLYALKAGDPHRLSIALAMEIGFRSLGGGKARGAIEKVAARARAAAEKTGDKAALGLAYACEGLARVLLGEFAAAQKRLNEGYELMLHNVSQFRWQLDVCINYQMAALVYLGQLKEMTRMVPILLSEALERGDEYLASGLRSWRSNLTWLALDDPEQARRQVREVEKKRPTGRLFHLQDFYYLLAHSQIDLYEGNPASAWKRVADAWSTLRRSMLLRIESVFIESHYLRARAAIAAARTMPQKQQMELLRDAEKSLRAIDKTGMPWAGALACLGRACIADLRGDDRAAAAGFQEATTRFRSCDMALYAAVATHRHGAAVGGAEGAGLVEEATGWMESEAIRNPTRMVALLAPGAG